MNPLETENLIETVLRKRFSKVLIMESKSVQSEERLLLRRRNLLEALLFLRNDPDTQLDTLVDLSAIHHGSSNSCAYRRQTTIPVFEVFYLLRSTRLKYRLRISILVSEQFSGVPSIGHLFRNAFWLEREIFDCFGIFVEGHPDLRRILMYPSFEGHPLTKSYPLELKQHLTLLKPS